MSASFLPDRVLFSYRLLEDYQLLDVRSLFEREMGVHYSSNSDEWATPQNLYDKLHKEFKFTLDPCANGKNAKCPRYYTKKDDGLSRSWKDEKVWINPPYSSVGAWMAKAAEEAKSNGATSVLLVPARTDTKWWHSHVMKADEVRLVQGRLKFGKATTGAPFPSAIVVFRPGSTKRKPSFSSAERE
jgi:site-specific DNA-methyltransferase (adenine-specific)